MADGAPQHDPYSYWRTACDCARKGLPLPGITDGKPDLGYYWISKVKDGPKLPVAIFEDDGELIITIDGMPIAPTEHNKTWLICARHPVEYAGCFDIRQETGKWPHELSETTEADQSIGANSGPALNATPLELLTRELEIVKGWISKTIVNSDALADECANKARELQRLKALVAEMHETEKAPHWAKCKEIDEKYLPLIRKETKTQAAGRATMAIRYLFAKVNEWIEAKNAENRRLQKEAQDKAIAAAAAEREKQAAAQGSDTPLLPPEPVSPPPPPAPAPAQEKASFGGLTGNRVRQRVTKRAAFDGDTPEEIKAARDKCYAYFSDHPDVHEVLLKLAQAIIKAKMAPPPGIKVVEETKAQ